MAPRVTGSSKPLPLSSSKRLGLLKRLLAADQIRPEPAPWNVIPIQKNLDGASELHATILCVRPLLVWKLTWTSLPRWAPNSMSSILLTPPARPAAASSGTIASITDSQHGYGDGR
jgi:hypothetical protein